MTTAPTAARDRDQIEREIVSKRRERELYVSPEGVGRIHGQLDELLTEWQEAADSEAAPA